jgi:hypothetical protein
MKKEKGKSSDLPIRIERITFGVLWQPRYEVLDSVGAVVDRILRAPASPFDSETFPTSGVDGKSQALINHVTGDQLRISEREIVLDTEVGTASSADIVAVAANFMKYALRPLKEIAGVRSVVRHGFMVRTLPSLEDTSVKASAYFLPEFSDARDITVRFSRRLGVTEAIARKGVDDYRNVNYVVSQSDQGRTFLTIDYQDYFAPALAEVEWEQRDFTAFVRYGCEFVSADLAKWQQRFKARSRAA